MTDKLMLFREAQKYLNVSRTTLYSLIKAKKVPAIKLGGQWRFRKERIVKWLDSQETIRKKRSK
jgi:excisionase family DNA binding protein